MAYPKFFLTPIEEELERMARVMRQMAKVRSGEAVYAKLLDAMTRAIDEVHRAQQLEEHAPESPRAGGPRV